MNEVFDRQDAMEKTAGDINLMGQVIRFTLDDFPGILADLREALGNQQWSDAGRLAHKLKGSAGASGARKLYLAALELELAGRDGDPNSLEKLDGIITAFEEFRFHPEIVEIASLDAGAEASIG